MTFGICENGHCIEKGHVFCPLCGMRVEDNLIMPDKFCLLGKADYLCKGSTGHVFSISGERKYALKLRNHSARKAAYEANIIKALDGCSGVVQTLDSCIVDGELWLLEEYLTPFTGYTEKNGLTARGALEMLVELCQILIECRKRGVLHLDIKPENLFVDDDGGLRLGDFSTSLFIDDIEKSLKHRGTLAYMAPEVYRGVSCGEVSDVYSVSILAYTLFNRRVLPFANKDSNELAAYKRLAGTHMPAVNCGSVDVSGMLMKYMDRGWAFEPAERIGSFEELKKVLEAFIAELDKRGCSDYVLVASEKISSGPTMDPEMTDVEMAGAVVEDKPSDWVFCPVCGSRASGDTMFCRICGNLLKDSNKRRARMKEMRPGAAGGERMRREYQPQTAMPMMASREPKKGLFGRIRNFVSDIGIRKAATTERVEVEAYCPSPSEEIFTSAKLPPEPAPTAEISKVKFSAIAPESLKKGDYSIIDLVMYEEAFRSAVEEVMAEHREKVRETRSGVVKVAEESTVRVQLDSPDAEVIRNEDTQVWYGEYLRFSFPVILPEDYSKPQVLFNATVYINDIVATRLSLIAGCHAGASRQMIVERRDILSAFVSYASQDRGQVAAVVQGMKKARPDMDIFFDVESLRSGDYWEQRLYNEIDKRDMLFLCWSRSAMKSEYVDKEWRYAYEKKGIDFIEPIPIEDPNVCPPPKELGGKHFNDRMLFVINAEKYAQNKY